MHKRNIMVGGILGAGLLGTLIAMGQDSGPPRPRPVMPPPASDYNSLPTVSAEPASKAEGKDDVKSPALPDAMPLPPVFSPAKEVLQPVQHVEPKQEPKKTIDAKDVLPKLPAPPVFDDPSPLG